MSKSSKHFYEFGPFRLDLSERLLLRGEEVVPLKKKAYEVLLVLVESNGQVLEKEELMRRVWPDSFVEESNLTHYIYALRRVLGDEKERSQYILTVPGRGYRFSAQVSEHRAEDEPQVIERRRFTRVVIAEDSTADGPVLAEAVPVLQLPPAPNQRARGWQWRTGYAALGLVIVTVAAYFFINRTPRQTTPLLTGKDTILLAEFENKTGEEVFDGTLRQGLAVQLQQSPFLDLFPDARVQATLKLMNRQMGEHVTREIGREICQRQGLKALIVGSIAKFDRHYSITLEALNSQTGDWLTLTQVEAEGRDQVLQALSRAATELRGKLGESLASLRQFDAPFERTTSSLEALREYTRGRAAVSKGQLRTAIEHQRQAVEKDQNFASAWLALATIYNNMNEAGLAAECAAKAFALRDRVSEYEKARITVFYYLYVTGELDQAIEAQQAFKQNYPRDYTGPGNLADFYRRTGQFEQAVTVAREATHMNPNSANLQGNLAEFLMNFNRFAEAKDVCARALSQHLDSFDIRGHLYALAFISNDTAAMQAQLAWASGKPEEYRAVSWQAQTAACAGAWRKSQELARHATALALRHDAPEAGARYLAEAALRAAVLGQGTQAVGLTDAALKHARNKYVLARAALALALAAQAVQAQPLVRELERQYPKDTLVNLLWLPTINAAFALYQGNMQGAIELLESAQRYEGAGEFWPQTLRAQAYLKRNQGAEAAAQYQQILDQRGQAPLSPLYPLAHLGLARAAALQGDAVKSRRAYQDFLTLWKEADTDLPVWLEAQREAAPR